MVQGVPGLSDPLMIEGYALRDVVMFVEEKRFRRVIFETDCFEIIRIWKLSSSDRSPISPILDDIRELRLNFFLLVYVLWVVWKMVWLTIVLNLLAQMGHIWPPVCLQFLVHSIVAECNSVFVD
jgi:hypothetical protein